MKSTAITVSGYLDSLPPDRRASVEAVRAVILDNLDKDYEECMLWGVAAYVVPQRVFPPGHHTDPKKPLMMCGVSSQQNDMVVYLMNVFGGGGGLGGDKDLRAWFEHAWAASAAGSRNGLCVSGKGGGGCCIRFKSLDDIPLDVIGQAVRRTPARTFVARYVNGLASRQEASRRPDSKKIKGPKASAATAKKAVTKVAAKSATTVAKKAIKKKPSR